MQRYVPPQDFENHPVANVLLSGNANFVPEVTNAWIQSAAISVEHLQFMQDCQLRSLITVPLIAHNRKLGALTFCFTAESDRHYTQADLALACSPTRSSSHLLEGA